MQQVKSLRIGCILLGLFSMASVVALPSVVDISDNVTAEDVTVGLSEADQIHTLQQQLESYRDMHLPERLDALNSDVQKLRGQLEEQAHALQQLQAERASAKTQADSQKPLISSLPAEEESIGLASSSVLTEKNAYQSALHALQAKNYTQATSDFQAFIKQYPKSAYVANAYYWLGEIYFLLGQFAPADTAFQTIVNRYPGSNKIPDTLLKRGLILSVRNKPAQAKKAFQYIVNHFPGTSAARLARLRLQA